MHTAPSKLTTLLAIRLLAAFAACSAALPSLLAQQPNAPASASPDSAVIRKTDTPSFEFFELHHLKPPQNAKGVLILAMTPDRPKVPLMQSAWTDFAASEKLAIASIGFSIKPGLRDRNAVGAELADLIDEAVTEAFGPDRKKLGYTQGWAAESFLRALQARPEGWLFWASKGALDYPLSARNQAGKGFPAGLVMSLQPEQYAGARRYFLDLRRIDPLQQRVTFVGSDAKSLDPVFLDRFFRQYVSAIYAGKTSGQGLWRFNYGHEGLPKEGQTPSVDAERMAARGHADFGFGRGGQNRVFRQEC